MFNILAKIVSRPVIANYLIRRSQRVPYLHLEGYMNRWWLFNPYTPIEELRQRKWCPFSIRVHHILREDQDRHLHDHPWDARTFILKGWYDEVKEDGRTIRREEGDTATLRFGEFHRITEVSTGGVFTLFVTFEYRGVWGFKVDGKKVPWREYLGISK